MILQRKMRFLPLLAMMIALSTSSCGYNSLQGMDEDVKASWSEVQNQYQRRADLIPNLVEVVKGYASHEKETLEAVINARSKATGVNLQANDLSDVQKFKQFSEAQGGLTQALSRLMVLTENYPDLKANQNYRDLQAQLEGTENRITVARNRYIEKVSEYNKGVRFFPTNLTAKFLLGLQIRETFTAAPEAAKAPEVKFK